MLKLIFAPGKDSFCTDFGLLILRLWVGLPMMLNHGIDKLKNFSSMSASFPDPLGVGSTASLALTLFAEFVCSMLIILGLVTRFGAFVLGVNMFVAFFMVHKHAMSGEHSGELAYIYLGAYLLLVIAGPGRFSVDKGLFGKGGQG